MSDGPIALTGLWVEAMSEEPDRNHNANLVSGTPEAVVNRGPDGEK